jgi:hypothetical protein
MSTDSVSSLRQRMIEDMNARKLCAGTQRGHIRSCKRFAAFLKRSAETATAEDIRPLVSGPAGPAVGASESGQLRKWHGLQSVSKLWFRAGRQGRCLTTILSGGA